jgi:hypothetical protein
VLTIECNYWSIPIICATSSSMIRPALVCCWGIASLPVAFEMVFYYFIFVWEIGNVYLCSWLCRGGSYAHVILCMRVLWWFFTTKTRMKVEASTWRKVGVALCTVENSKFLFPWESIWPRSKARYVHCIDYERRRFQTDKNLWLHTINQTQIDLKEHGTCFQATFPTWGRQASSHHP